MTPVGLALATYTLIDATSVGNAAAGNFVISVPRVGHSLAVSNGDLILTVAANVWQGDAGGNWSELTNWKFAVPDAPGIEAYFNGTGGSPVTVDSPGAVTAAMYFSSPTSYTIQGSQTLGFDSGDTGSAAVVLSSTAAAQTLLVDMVLRSNLSVTSNASGLTMSGSIIETGGSHGIALNSGLLILSGSGNSYSGSTTLNGGTLRAGAASIFSPNSVLTTVAGGSVDLAGLDQTVSGLAGSGGTVTSAGAAALTLLQANNTTFAGQISGEVTLVKSGTGTLTLAAAQSYAGNTTVSNGILQMGGTNYLSPGSSLQMNGGTLDLAGYGQAVAGLAGGSGNITSTASVTLIVNQVSTTTYGGILSGSVTLAKNGSGLLVLSNSANTFTGGVTIAGGSVVNGASNVLPDNLTVDVGTTGIWDLNGAYEKIASVATSAFGTVNLNGGTLELANQGGGSGLGIHWNLAGNGALIISGGSLTTDNVGHWDMTGPIYITGGHLNAAHGDATSTIHASDVYISGGWLALMNVDNRLQPTVQIHMSSGGTIFMRQQDGWSDPGANQAVAVLEGTGGTVTNNYAATYTITVNQVSGTYSFGGLLSGNLNVTKSGAGTWILNNTASVNSYTGTTQISGGILRLGANEQLPDAGTLKIIGGTLDLNGYNETIGATTLSAGTINGVEVLSLGGDMTLSGASAILGGAIDLGGGTRTFTIDSPYTFQYGGPISHGTFRKAGTGTIFLGAVFNADLQVAAGTLDIQTFDHSISSLTLAGGTLTGSGGKLNIGTSIELQSGQLNVPLLGSPSVVKTTSGTVVMGGAYLPGGSALTVNGGALDIGSTVQHVTGMTLVGGAVVSSGGGTLDFGLAAELQSGTISACLSGNSISKTTSGTVTISVANTYSGGTTINNGVLNLAPPSASVSVLGSGDVFLNGGTLVGLGTVTGSVSAGVDDHVIRPTGLLTTGSLFLGSQTTLDFSAFGDGGRITSTGSLNVLDSGGLVRVTAPFGLAGGSHTLFDAAVPGTAADGNFALSDICPGYTLAVTNGDLVLTVLPNLWKGTGGGNWSGTANWTVAVPNAPGVDARFVGVGGSPVVIDEAGAVAASVFFDGSTSYDIQGSQGLTFDRAGVGNAGVILTSTAAAQTISAAVALNSDLMIQSNAAGLTITGPISGSDRVVTLASGLVVLSSTANSYTGSTILAGGTLRASGPASLASTADIKIKGSAVLDLTGDGSLTPTIHFAGGGMVCVATGNTISTTTLDLGGAGTSTLAGGGTLSITGPAGVSSSGGVLNITNGSTLAMPWMYSVADSGKRFIIQDTSTLLFSSYISTSAGIGDSIGSLMPGGTLRLANNRGIYSLNRGTTSGLILDVSAAEYAAHGAVAFSSIDKSYVIDVGDNALQVGAYDRATLQTGRFIESSVLHAPPAYIQKMGGGALVMLQPMFQPSNSAAAMNLYWIVGAGTLMSSFSGGDTSLGVTAPAYFAAGQPPVIAQQHLEGIEVKSGATLVWQGVQGSLPASVYGGLASGNGDGFNSDEFVVETGATLRSASSPLVLGYQYVPDVGPAQNYPLPMTVRSTSGATDVSLGGTVTFRSGISGDTTDLSILSGANVTFKNDIGGVGYASVRNITMTGTATVSAPLANTQTTTLQNGGTLNFDPGPSAAITYVGNVVNNGTMHVSSGTVMNVGIISCTTPGLSSVAGLQAGRVDVSGADYTSPNPKTYVKLDLSDMNTQYITSGLSNDLWADNSTWIYTGQFYSSSGTYFFGKNFDDTVFLTIDGSTLIQSHAYNTVVTASATLSQGWHNFEVRFGQDGGYVGPHDTFAGMALAYSTNGGATWANIPADLFRYSVYQQGTLTIDGGAELQAAGLSNLNVVNITDGTLTLTGTGAHTTQQMTIIGGTLRANETATVSSTEGIGISAAVFDVPGGKNLTVAGTMNNATSAAGGFIKTGAGMLVLASTSNTFSGPVAIRQGAVSVSAAGALGDDSSTNSLTLGGGGSALIATGSFQSSRSVTVTGASNAIDVAQGQAVTFSGTFTINSNSTVAKTGGGSLTISGPASYGTASALNLSVGTATLASVGGDNANRNLSVAVDHAAFVAGATQYLASLTLTNSAKASINAVGTGVQSRTIKTNAVSIDATSLLDLGDNNLIVNYTNDNTGSQLQAIVCMIKSGGGMKTDGAHYDWDGTRGITSSSIALTGTSAIYRGLGVRDYGFDLANRPPQSSIEGVTIESGTAAGSTASIAVKYTWVGDMDLDGKVTVNDYLEFLNYYRFQPATAYKSWMTGDFNYDGLINVNDYLALLNAYRFQGGQLGSGQAITDEMWAIGMEVVSATPEPATLVLLAAGVVVALTRWRRRLK
jgi:fibronectin-binding autotransporter adhesin